MTYIHFHHVNEPWHVLIAAELPDGTYSCMLPYKERGKLRTHECIFSKDSVAVHVQQGTWILTKVNGYLVEDINEYKDQLLRKVNNG